MGNVSGRQKLGAGKWNTRELACVRKDIGDACEEKPSRVGAVQHRNIVEEK